MIQVNQAAIPVDAIFLQIVLKLAHSTVLAVLVFLCIKVIHYVHEKLGAAAKDSAMMVLQFSEEWASTLMFVVYLGLKMYFNIRKWTS